MTRRLYSSWLISIVVLLYGIATVGLLQFATPISGNVYVAATGSDLNPGTQALPWQSLTNVNSRKFLSSACVNLNGGDTFGGGTTGINSATLKCVSSYGTGRATISSGNSAPCLVLTNISNFNGSGAIDCRGGSTTVSTTDGIDVINSVNGTSLIGPTITGWTVENYGGNCFTLEGTNGTAGFNGGSLTLTTFQSCTGELNSAGITSCINVGAATPGTHSIIGFQIVQNDVSKCVGIGSASGIFRFRHFCRRVFSMPDQSKSRL